MKTTSGFTLVELVIVIVIVGILSMVGVSIYKGFTDKAKMTEAKTLTGAILSAEKVYHAENTKWHEISSWASLDEVLTVDSRANKYFKTFVARPSSRYSGAMEAAAKSDSLNMIVYQYWPLDDGEVISLPKWETYDLTGAILYSEW